MDVSTKTIGRVTPWNKGELLGQKPPLKRKEIWANPDSVAVSKSPAMSRSFVNPPNPMHR